jgi:hypothetical protein
MFQVLFNLKACMNFFILTEIQLLIPEFKKVTPVTVPSTMMIQKMDAATARM